MDKKIPLYFDTIILNSPIQDIKNTNSNISRLKVGVFTKYKNRNGSYITDEYAQHLIESATKGNIPVVGFFDPETQTWASHTGPALANGYGYVESFLGWEPFTDTDGITRDYAVFSVILFTEYFEEAQKVLGQNQSMELDEKTIEGDWAKFDDEEYFVYTKGDMKGFCIIGAHEPCFSVSSFFEKNDEAYKIQYEKFSSLLSDLKTVVEEAEKKNKGGEQTMNEFENQEQNTLETNEVAVTEELVQPEASQSFENENENTSVVSEEMNNFEELQQKYNDLQAAFNELQSNYEDAKNHINELESFQENSNSTIEGLQNQISELQTSLNSYENQAKVLEENRKNELIKKYEKVLKEDEITSVRENVQDFSYEELNSKLAVIFAESKISEASFDKVPLPEEPESQFASFMKKYKKN